MIGRLHGFCLRHAPALILAASIIVLGTALLSQYWGGLQPCKLCIWQRWPYVATIALSLVALLGLGGIGVRRALVALCGAVFAIGAGIAFYHAGVEQGWFAGPSSCSGDSTAGAQTVEDLRRMLMAQPVVRCDEIPWSLFGISMAGYNAIVSAALAVAGLYAASRMGRKGRNR